MQEIMSKEELEEQKEMILDLLRSTERDGIDKLADYLSDSTDFFTGMPCSLLTASTIQNCANARQVATIRWPETMLANRRMVREAGRMINSSSRLIGASRK